MLHDSEHSCLTYSVFLSLSELQHLWAWHFSWMNVSSTVCLTLHTDALIPQRWHHYKRCYLFHVVRNTVQLFFSAMFSSYLSFSSPSPFLSQCISFKNNILGNYWPLLLLVETKFHTAADSEMPRNKSFTFQLINPFFHGCFAIPFKKKGYSNIFVPVSH